jgi:hypothetical protein
MQELLELLPLVRYEAGPEIADLLRPQRYTAFMHLPLAQALREWYNVPDEWV